MHLTFKRIYILCFFAVVLFVIYYCSMDRLTPITSNAYIQADVVHISSREAGHVDTIYVVNDQKVKKGQLLISLDKAKLSDLVELAKEKYRYESSILNEYKHLLSNGNISNDKYNNQLSLVKELKVSLGIARLNLEHANIYSPVTGYVSNLNLKPGTNINKNDPVMSLIDTKSLHLVANFKENNLGSIHLNSPALVSLAMYPGKIFHAKVTNIGWGVNIGNQDTSGDLKVVKRGIDWVHFSQRFPVDLKIDASELTAHPLRVGESATVLVKGNHPLMNDISEFWIKVSSYLGYVS
ncbi:efflux RND transporter periplasmic adaptor subunit [Vibrio sp. S4M6]|uniref:HlyD family secretion protein n=1 Tax=Vibrio sinus TaxID=2946865 RepID=UPI00202A715F|nr:efflux RND transporter periplasmic adaptor subunit [Vibrio sinus]MCL9781172.1 efflux RND transporter periplasmic adaptor subunit [Vibrio sinus]